MDWGYSLPDEADVPPSNLPLPNLHHPHGGGAFDDAIMDPSLMLFGDQQYDGISPTSLGSSSSLSPINRYTVTAGFPKQEVTINASSASASTSTSASAGDDSKKKPANDSSNARKPQFNTFNEKSAVALSRENEAKLRFDHVRVVRTLPSRVSLSCVLFYCPFLLSPT